MMFDVAVIGGGPAGLAAAISACKNNAKVVIIEQQNRLGGILNQCIHNGFGLHYFGVELTGPEYAKRWVDEFNKYNATVKLNTMVTHIEKIDTGVEISALSENGLEIIKSKTVVLAMGCRERPAGAINLCGTRPAGIFSAGQAQKFVNIHGKMVGKNIVILGSGDIGLIMARRLTCEGANVIGVYEIMSKCGGLARNVAQCLNDFNIPLHLSTTVVATEGKTRVTGVWVAPVDEALNSILNKKQFIKCDTLLLSVGLIPEIELFSNFNLEISPATGSAVVNEFFQTTCPNLFICGNVLHVNDLADNVSNEGLTAGECAAKFAKGTLEKTTKVIEIEHDKHIKYTVPKYIHSSINDEVCTISFRVDKEYKKATIIATSNGEIINKKPSPAVNAGEMQIVKLNKKLIKDNLKIDIEV